MLCLSLSSSLFPSFSLSSLLFPYKTSFLCPKPWLPYSKQLRSVRLFIRISYVVSEILVTIIILGITKASTTSSSTCQSLNLFPCRLVDQQKDLIKFGVFLSSFLCCSKQKQKQDKKLFFILIFEFNHAVKI